MDRLNPQQLCSVSTDSVCLKAESSFRSYMVCCKDPTNLLWWHQTMNPSPVLSFVRNLGFWVTQPQTRSLDPGKSKCLPPQTSDDNDTRDGQTQTFIMPPSPPRITHALHIARLALFISCLPLPLLWGSSIPFLHSCSAPLALWEACLNWGVATPTCSLKRQLSLPTPRTHGERGIL